MGAAEVVEVLEVAAQVEAAQMEAVKEAVVLEGERVLAAVMAWEEVGSAEEELAAVGTVVAAAAAAAMGMASMALAAMGKVMVTEAELAAQTRVALGMVVVHKAAAQLVVEVMETVVRVVVAMVVAASEVAELEGVAQVAELMATEAELGVMLGRMAVEVQLTSAMKAGAKVG